MQVRGGTALALDAETLPTTRRDEVANAYSIHVAAAGAAWHGRVLSTLIV